MENDCDFNNRKNKLNSSKMQSKANEIIITKDGLKYKIFELMASYDIDVPCMSCILSQLSQEIIDMVDELMHEQKL